MEGRSDLVVVGADRIAANGDAANKIGTYGVAVLAQAHGIPFYVAAPVQPFDLSLPDGGASPSSSATPARSRTLRPADRARGGRGLQPRLRRHAPPFITGIITEKGIVHPPYGPALRALFG